MSDTYLALTPAVLSDLRSVLAYAEIGEDRDYEECDALARAHHILHPIRRLNAWLDGAADPETSFVYIQQGGVGTEYYLHAFDTADDAEAGRVDCAGDDGGGFPTTAVVAIPALTSDQLDAVEELIQQIDTLTYAVTDTEDDEDEKEDGLDAVA
ncbi:MULTISPECIES: hypothetical protein [Nocardia]|uniref:hypothetical protein n=1 Tax=Nocardia TaxID=1817 RepID=UPI0003048BEA|nr:MULTISPECIES: hypothetical protein [Nocardia]